MKKNDYSDDKYFSTLDKFVEFCNEHKIWYSLANKTLLSALTNINYYKQNDNLEVFMTYESYKKLLNLFPEYIVDSINKNSFYFTNPFFVSKSSEIVIKIVLLIPANAKKCEKYYSLLNYRRQKIGFWISFNQKTHKLKRIYYKLKSRFLASITWNEIYSNIFDPKYNGYFLVDDMKLNINKNWIPSITFESKTIKLLDVNCSYIKEADVFLTKRYGFDWDKKVKIKPEKVSYSWINQVND